jgi:FkbM family methyltransferase
MSRAGGPDVLDFSAISSRSFAGRGLRQLLKALPSEMRVPVLQGSVRGAWWIVGSATHGCWLGSYERDKQERLRASLGRGAVVYDVGANVGFYTLLASRAIGPEGRVFAFEPLPRNLGYLNRHIAMNRIANAVVIPSAVSEAEGSTGFTEGQNASTGRIDSSARFQVPAISLDAFVYAQCHPPPAVIKMDIEGGEAAALRGASRVLKEARPVLFLATHGVEVHRNCLEILRTAGYRIASLDALDVESTSEVVAQP